MAITAGWVSMAAVVIFVSSVRIFFSSVGNYFPSAGMHASSFSTWQGQCKPNAESSLFAEAQPVLAFESRFERKGTATIFGDDRERKTSEDFGSKWKTLEEN